MTFDIQEELKKLPKQPGVYIMHDTQDAIIYVGKAVSLRNRVRQYFQSPKGKSLKVASMVQQIARFEYIVTDSELEALVLENNLIKEHRPKYNTMLKDDKTYPYIKVTQGEVFPRVILTRSMKKDNAHYFGPYTNAGAVRDVIALVRKLFRIRTCQKKIPSAKEERPCLYYHIGECPAPCAGLITQEAYAEHVSRAVDFLNGNVKEVVEDLKEKMTAASLDMEYEKAIEYRDLITAIELIGEKQKITSMDQGDRDVIGLARDGEDAVAQVFFVRDGKLTGREHFLMHAAPEEENAAVLAGFLMQFYDSTPHLPREIMLPFAADGAELIEEWLSEKKKQRVFLRVPQRGTKEKLVEMASENAEMILTRDRDRLKREEDRTYGAVREIADLLGMEEITRMEAYDISNISGYESVGSMVVFENGRPKRSDYRKFRIKTVVGPDDYASMEEVLTRRFARAKEGSAGFETLPDLLLMDGGRGQVNIALSVLDKLSLPIPVCGMVKDDSHNTRGLYYENVELPIEKTSEGFKLITRIQDEAHRFAIEYHRLLRSKGQVRSVLDGIEGIGPARRKALLRAFGSVEAIRDTDEETLAKAPSMNRAAAHKVWTFFHPDDNIEPTEGENEGLRPSEDDHK